MKQFRYLGLLISDAGTCTAEIKSKKISAGTNLYVFDQVNEKESFYTLNRKRRWHGDILRGESLDKQIIEGRIEGKKRRGNHRIMMLDDIKAYESYEKIKNRAMARVFWRNRMP